MKNPVFRIGAGFWTDTVFDIQSCRGNSHVTPKVASRSGVHNPNEPWGINAYHAIMLISFHTININPVI
jgi:hypothetical protein